MMHNFNILLKDSNLVIDNGQFRGEEHYECDICNLFMVKIAYNNGHITHYFILNNKVIEKVSIVCKSGFNNKCNKCYDNDGQCTLSCNDVLIKKLLE